MKKNSINKIVSGSSDGLFKEVEYWDFNNDIKKREKHHKGSWSQNNDGKEDGVSTWWYKNGKKRKEINYKDGKENGLWITWYEDGTKESEVHWKNGERDGVSTGWYPNGNKRWEGHFIDGGPNGISTHWFEDGTEESEHHWKDGELVEFGDDMEKRELNITTKLNNGNG